MYQHFFATGRITQCMTLGNGQATYMGAESKTKIHDLLVSGELIN